jgi:hypothetical protein
VTGSTGKKASPFNFITHQLMAFVFLAITSVVGIWQALTVSSFTLALLWNLLNTFILGLFVATAVRESRGNRREAKGLPRVSPKRAARKAAKAQKALASDQNLNTGRLLAETAENGLLSNPKTNVPVVAASNTAVAPAFDERSAADRTLASVESAK